MIRTIIIKMVEIVEAAKLCLIGFMHISIMAIVFILIAAMAIEINTERKVAVERATNSTVLKLKKEESRKKSMKMHF